MLTSPLRSTLATISAKPALPSKLKGFTPTARAPLPIKVRDFKAKATTFAAYSSFATNWAPTMPSQGGPEAMGVVLPAVEAHVKEAVAALKNGLVIAVPTDTLYGLACDACSAAAIQRIYDIKGRSATSPLAVCVGDVGDIKRYGTTSYLPDSLLQELLPGPVTVVLRRDKDSLLDESLNPGLLSIGVRIPDSHFIQMVARSFGGALALTSANISGQQSTIEVCEFGKLWPYCAFIFDAGRLAGGRSGSTIVDLTKSGSYRIIREGSALSETKAVLNRHGLEDLQSATNRSVQIHCEKLE